MKTATVFQEGRFIKVLDSNGQDISNQIDRNLRRLALGTNYVGQLVYDDNLSEWRVSSSSIRLNLKTVNLEDMSDNPIISKIEDSIKLKPNELIISDLKWKYLVRSAIRGRNIAMIGPAGSGKTMTAHVLAKTLERKYFYFNLGATQDPRSTLIGNTHFNKDQGTFFSESVFVTAIQTENAVILLDELSRAHPEAWNILMSVLDLEQRHLRLDEKDGSPTIKVANGVCFIATANIGSEFTSTRVMDRALMDRFISIEMDMLNVEDETRLLKMKFPEVDENELVRICQISSDIRSEYKSESSRVTTTLSTRACVELASLIYDGFSLEESAEVAIYTYFSKEGGIDSERTFVKQIVQKYCESNSNIKNVFNTEDVLDSNSF
jgi:nitric oxide reductase NorQ protein